MLHCALEEHIEQKKKQPSNLLGDHKLLLNQVHLVSKIQQKKNLNIMNPYAQALLLLILVVNWSCPIEAHMLYRFASPVICYSNISPKKKKKITLLPVSVFLKSANSER